MFHYLADISTYSNKKTVILRKHNFKTAKHKVCLRSSFSSLNKMKRLCFRSLPRIEK